MKTLFVRSCLLVLSILFLSWVLPCPAETDRPVRQAQAGSYEADPAARAEARLEAGDFDGAIELLEDPATQNPNDFRINVVYSLALLEKCAVQKAKGDPAYRKLVYTPYQIGARLANINRTRAEPYYIVGWALVINERPNKGLRWLKKALYFDGSNADYWTLFGDACAGYAAQEATRATRGDSSAGTNTRRIYRQAESAYQKALSFAGDNQALKAELNAKLSSLP